MKLRLEATPEELREQGSELINRLSKALRPYAPDVAEALSKASTQEREPGLKHQVLRDLHGQAAARYQQQLDLMLGEIFEVLETRIEAMTVVAKADPNYLASIIDLESVNYDKIKTELTLFGYHDHEYDEGGALYGQSVNQLRDVLEQLRIQEAKA